MAIAAGFHHPPLPLPTTPRRTSAPLNRPICICICLRSAPLLLRSPATSGSSRRARATATPTHAARDDDDRALPDPESRGKSPLDLAPLLAAAAVAATTTPPAALAASGGSMGGCSDDDSFSSSSYGDDSSTSDDFSSSSWWSSSSPSSSSSPETAGDAEASEATHVSVGTAAAPSPEAKRRQDMVFWGTVALASAGAAALLYAASHSIPPRTTVVKLQVALRGAATAKSFQRDLNDIAEKVEASNRRWYKFILTETIHSLRRHKDRCISSTLSVDLKDSWRQHFNKISIEERSKFDEETLCNLDGIKRKKSYSKKRDGSRNKYIVVTILIAAEGALNFREIRNSADLEAVVGKLDSIPAGEIRGIHVLWTPQQENDILSEEELREDYPYLKPLCDI